MSAVLLDIADGIATVTLNRPRHRNAFNKDMAQRLSAMYRALDTDDAVRVIVLTGTPPAFCAGADMTAGTETFTARHAEFSSSPVKPPAFDLRKPVIAAVNGHAIGIGLTIAMQADIRIVADDAKYSIPQVRRGVIPDALSHWTVPRAAGIAAAAEILLTGRTFDGAEAVRLGVASRSLPAAEVLPAAMEMAQDVAANASPMSVALSKRLLWGALRHSFTPEQVDDYETELHHRVMGSADAAEGVRSFLEHRAPEWTAQLSTDWKNLPWE